MKFEILIATMYRKDLSFLYDIFSKNNIDDYAILIINQTSEDELLYSDVNNIRVINSFERGTSASRNLAIKNAIGDICLFGDDDLIYEPNFDKIILSSFKKHEDAYLLSFEAISGISRKAHGHYPLEGKHTIKTLKPIHMVVMAFRRVELLESNVLFNEYFSYGGKFSGGTEYVFLMNAYSCNLIAYHISKTIVYHDGPSSGKDMGSDRSIHTNAARINHFNKSWYAKLWLIKYVLFLIRYDYIKLSEMICKFKVGIKGINDYNELYKQGLIKRQNSL